MIFTSSGGYMDLLLFLNARFVHKGNDVSQIYSSSHTFSYEKHARYLPVFNNVKLVLRSRKCTDLDDENLYRSTGEKITAEFIPYFEGPWQFARKHLFIKRTIRKVIEKNNNHAIIVRVPCPIGFLAIDIFKNKRPFGVEVIADPWDTFSPGSVKTILRRFLRIYFALKLKKACKIADAALYVTENALQSRYPNPNRVFSASNVELKTEDFVPTPRKYKKKNRWKIIYVGTLSQLYKAPDILLKAVQKVVKNGFDLEVNIIGDGGYKQYLIELASKLGIKDRTQFYGNLRREDVFNCLDQSDLFVLPSRQEGLPRAMIEAMARGLPCIGSTVGGIPELLEPQDMVPPNDVDALAEKIIEVISNIDRLNSMSERNLMKAKEYRDDILQARRLEFYKHVKDKTEEWLSNINKSRK